MDDPVKLFMPMALRAVDKILDNLADSDFVLNNPHALDALMHFRTDMAADIATEIHAALQLKP